MYDILIDKKALLFLDEISEADRKRIIAKLDMIVHDPLKYFEPLTERDDCKLRVGKYRIIADIDHARKEIRITRISIRKNAYK